MEFNEEWFEGFEQGWKVPIDGSETDAVRSVSKQMRDAGIEPDQAGVLRLVRQVRSAHARGETE